MKLYLFVTLAALAAACGTAFAQCEVSPEVRTLLNKPEFRRNSLIDSEADKEARNAAYAKALADHPDEYFILRSQLLSFDSADERVKWVTPLRDQHPDSPMYLLLYAQAQLGKDTPGALRQIETLSAAHPEMPWPYIVLAQTFNQGKFRDRERARKALGAYAKLCPDSTDNSFLNQITQSGSPEQVAAEAAALRKILEADTGPVQTGKWETLWRMEFKAHPVAEHAAVRERIAADVKRFGESDHKRTAAWLAFLRSGSQSMGDTAAVDRLNAEILESAGESEEAKRIVQDRWRKAHPYPGGPGPHIDYERALLAASREWHAKWPDDSMFQWDIFSSQKDLPETTSEQLVQAGDEFQAAYRKNGNFWMVPPTEFAMAEAYVARKVRLDQIPEMVRTAYRQFLEREAANTEDDRNDDQLREMTRSSGAAMHLQKLKILLDCYAASKQPEQAKAIEAELATIEVTKMTSRSSVLAVRAKAAELEGRKLDALVLYRAAAAESTGPAPDAKKSPAADAERLWKELGGSPELYSLLVEKPKPVEATDSRWEKPRNPLPSFALSDLQGKSWKLTALEGKTLLINIWATWCGPCVSEHPAFQKLYDSLKDRPDVQVLSFNVDDDIGKVAPYIAEHKYSFPVIPAKDVVDTVVPSLAIPRNWLVNGKGKLEWEQIGYGAEASWQEMMMSKLEEVGKK